MVLVLAGRGFFYYELKNVIQAQTAESDEYKIDFWFNVACGISAMFTVALYYVN